MKTLEDLKIGDKVYMRTKYSESIHTVKRTTQTLFILDNDERFKRSDGSKVGSCGYSTCRIEPFQDEDEQRIFLRNLWMEHVKYMQAINWERGPSLGTLIAIRELIENGDQPIPEHILQEANQCVSG